MIKCLTSFGPDQNRPIRWDQQRREINFLESNLSFENLQEIYKDTFVSNHRDDVFKWAINNYISSRVFSKQNESEIEAELLEMKSRQGQKDIPNKTFTMFFPSVAKLTDEEKIAEFRISLEDPQTKKVSPLIDTMEAQQETKKSLQA